MKLWTNEIPFYNSEAETPNEITFYPIHSAYPLPCVVVLPGGGYHGRARHEAGDIAEFFNSRGMHAAVVEYRVAPNCHPAPLADAQRAIRILRANAKAWKIDPNRIVTCGFSAGGHLCASTILFPDVYSETYEKDEIDNESCIPNGAILGYPVIHVTDDMGHVGSGRNLLGDRYEELKEQFNLENYVNESTPPVFLWHTSEDSAVNVKNSLLFAEKLRDAQVPFELHVFPHGKHGLGLAKTYSDVSKWANLAADWILNNIQ